MQRVSRIALSLFLTAVFVVGAHFGVRPVYGCGTNAGGGNCKQASQQASSVDTWNVVRLIVTHMRLVWLP